jgi:hypothetical protein
LHDISPHTFYIAQQVEANAAKGFTTDYTLAITFVYEIGDTGPGGGKIFYCQLPQDFFIPCSGYPVTAGGSPIKALRFAAGRIEQGGKLYAALIEGACFQAPSQFSVNTIFC